MRATTFLCGALLLAGCAQHIATVKRIDPHFVTVGSPDSELITAQRDLQDAEQLKHRNPTHVLGDYLASAKIAAQQLDRKPNDTQARDLYNFAVARCISVIESTPLNPWTKPLRVPSPDGEFVLTTARSSQPERDPVNYEIIPADSIITGGTFLQQRVTVPGIGAPVVAVGREEKSNFRQSFATQRVYGTVTAILRFSDHHAHLEFFEPYATTQVSLHGHAYPLAADFTAAGAVGLTQLHPEKLGLARLLRPEKYADTARLTRLQPYDPARIPVVFVHGLQDSPACWVTMVNTLRENPEIRRHYQFWVYSYPSGYPYFYSALLFRHELDAVDRAFPSHKNIVLVGHSMGGMISRLMVTDAGNKIWFDYFGKSPAQTDIPEKDRKLLEEAFIFNHRPEVKRVIFMSTPHRGADMASNWIGRIGTSFVRMPFLLAATPFRAIQAAQTPDSTAMHLKRIPNSIDTLSPNNRFVLEINKFPITPSVPYHSIIGDRGRGDTPNSSDGVVAYWSSHLDGAQSELIVPSNHSSPRNPQAIAEVRRILKLHLKKQSHENENIARH